MTKTKLDTTEEAPAVETTRVLAVPRGRGRVGKTTLDRWMADRARSHGRDIIIADGDRSNQTLAAFFPDATTPPSAEDDDMRDWLTRTLEDLAERHASMVLDVGGGDFFIGRYGRELDLAEFCQAIGVTPLSMIVVGPEEDDLQSVQAIEAVGAFMPRHTILVLNEQLVSPGRDALRAFEPLMALPAFKRLVSAGARPIIVPRLGCMPDVAAWASFTAAAGGEPGPDGRPLGPVRRQMVTKWLRDMEGAFAPVADWLP